MTAHPRPVAPEERIRALDVLRGWALFGVLWSNLNDQYAPTKAVTRLDGALAWTQQWLLESRFYTLLILLFGIGFGIQLTRAEQQTTDLRDTYYRRTATLLLIGILHGTLIWRGDILTIYALVAFALVMFRTASQRQLILAAAFFWFVGPVLVREAMYLSGLRVMVPDTTGESVLVYAHGAWRDIQRVRLNGYLQWLGRWGLSSYVSILAAFLIGLWTVKSRYLRRVLDDPRSTRRLLAVAACVTLIGIAVDLWGQRLWPRVRTAESVVPRFPFPYFQLAMLRLLVLRFFQWSTEGMAIAYACLLLLVWQRPMGARVLEPLAAAGRMALTTYLTQSIVCTLLFYSYGLGWYGSVSLTGMMLITFVLFALQMSASMWWLARFNYGPAEWVWRTMTYGRVPEMRVRTLATT